MNHRDSFINLVDEFGNTQAGNEMEEISLMAKYEKIKTYSDFRIPNNTVNAMCRYENYSNGSNFKENQFESRLLINPCYGNFENNECLSKYI